jgi:acyl-CoA thioesterase I
MMKSFNGYSIAISETQNSFVVEKSGESQQITVPPLSRITVESEFCSPVTPSRWDIAPMRNRTNTSCVYTVPDAVEVGSIQLNHIAPSGERHVLKRDVDYSIDSVFCGVTLNGEWNTDEHSFSLDYTLRLQRVDVLAVLDDKVKLFCGPESMVCPRWPQLPPGWQAIARISIRFSDVLNEEVVFPVSSAEHTRLVNYPVQHDQAAAMADAAGIEQPHTVANTVWTDVIKYDEYLRGSEDAYSRLRQKFGQSKDFNLVYFGDSVTQGGDVLVEHRWTNRFTQYLTETYPDKNFTIVNAAIGGTNSTFGRERFEQDVLAHKPDVVTVNFILNDNGLDDESAIDHNKYFVDELRRIGAEPVYITSNMNTGSWMPGLDHAEQRIIDFCDEQDLVCLDVYHIWTDLPKYAIPYETLLANGINHPDNVAVGLFYEMLKRAMCS